MFTFEGRSIKLKVICLWNRCVISGEKPFGTTQKFLQHRVPDAQISPKGIGKIKMKKFFMLVLAICLSTLAFADDIIVTRNAQRINAKIEEVGVDVIKYRRIDNLTGPLYTLLKSEISTILYENGTVDVFDNYQKSTNNGNNNNYYSLTDPIVYDGGDFYQKGKKLYDQDLRKINFDTYEHYKKSQKLIGAGWGMFITGMLFTFPMGLTLLFENGYYDRNSSIIYNYNRAQEKAALSFIIIGPSITTASIPLLAVGYTKRRNSIEDFEQGRTSNVSLNLTSSQNGIGLALNF